MRDWKIIKWMFICVLICVVPYMVFLYTFTELPNWYGYVMLAIIAYFFGMCLFSR